jgi:hypothetical protein
MRHPSKHAHPLDAPAEAPAASTVRATDIEQPLTAADFEFLSGIDPQVAGDERVRSDMLALLTEGETVEAITKYAPTLLALGVNPGATRANVVQIRGLQRLRRRLDLAQGLVTRQLQATGAPSMEFVSQLHRVIEGTPEQSPLRVAFSLFLRQWQANFRSGGRPAKAGKPGAEKPAEAADKTPPTK